VRAHEKRDKPSAAQDSIRVHSTRAWEVNGRFKNLNAFENTQEYGHEEEIKMR